MLSNQDRTFTPPHDGLFPPGFTYRPPLDVVCPSCGQKHIGNTNACSPCRDALASGDYRRNV